MSELGEGYTLDADSIHQLRQDHDLLMGMVGGPSGRRYISRSVGGSGGAQGRLTTPLVASDNGLTAPTTFTFVRYVIDQSIDPQTDPVTMMEDVDDDDEIVETTGVNRSPLEASVDGHVVCVRIAGEWVAVLAFDVCSE